MTQLPVVSGREVITALSRVGRVAHLVPDDCVAGSRTRWGTDPNRLVVTGVRQRLNSTSVAKSM